MLLLSEFLQLYFQSRARALICFEWNLAAHVNQTVVNMIILTAVLVWGGYTGTKKIISYPDQIRLKVRFIFTSLYRHLSVMILTCHRTVLFTVLTFSVVQGCKSLLHVFDVPRRPTHQSHMAYNQTQTSSHGQIKRRRLASQTCQICHCVSRMMETVVASAHCLHVFEKAVWTNIFNCNTF